MFYLWSVEIQIDTVVILAAVTISTHPRSHSAASAAGSSAAAGASSASSAGAAGAGSPPSAAAASAGAGGLATASSPSTRQRHVAFWDEVWDADGPLWAKSARRVRPN